MRSSMAGVLVTAVVMTMAASGSAGEPAKAVSTRPKIELAPQVRVVGFHRAAGQTGAYTGGALPLGVDVENKSNSLVEDVVVKLDVGPQVLEAMISIPAHSTRTATFTDGDGLASSCKAKPYNITLARPGVAPTSRDALITPSCSFSSTIEQTWNQMSPDHVEANKAGNAYLTAPSLVTAPTCSSGPTMKVRIVNKATASSPSLIVQAKEWTASGKVKAQTAAAFPLASNEQKELLLSPVAGGNGDVPAKLKVGITDWTKSLGGHTSDGGIFVNTTRSCALSFSLD
jgi:hypothetical protein